MVRIAVLSVPMAIIWLALSNELTLDSFLLGYIVAFAILYLVADRNIEINLAKLPGQLLATVIYTIKLLWEILIASLDIARRVLDPRLPIEPDIIAVSVQDPTNNAFIAGLSMHAITVTPGEMVVGYDEDEGVMYVHVLNAAKSRQTLDKDQASRLALIKRIMGQDD